MKVPNCDEAIIPMRKINDYLLSGIHPVGRSKAKFFHRIGFDKLSLELALKQHIIENEITLKINTKFGEKYLIKGQIDAPNGKKYTISSIWVIECNKRNPYFVTAYPSK